MVRDISEEYTRFPLPNFYDGHVKEIYLGRIKHKEMKMRH
jgi:hypothetical protein